MMQFLLTKHPLSKLRVLWILKGNLDMSMCIFEDNQQMAKHFIKASVVDGECSWHCTHPLSKQNRYHPVVFCALDRWNAIDTVACCWVNTQFCSTGLGITARDNCEEQDSDQIQFEIPSIYHVYIFPNLIHVMCVSFSALILLMDHTKPISSSFLSRYGWSRCFL